MKVTGKVTGLSFRNICLVTVPDGVDVPVGAKVTIKWAKCDENENENVHSCEQSVRRDKLISRMIDMSTGKGGQWYVSDECPQGAGWTGDGSIFCREGRTRVSIISGITFCPFCGVRLPV